MKFCGSFIWFKLKRRMNSETEATKPDEYPFRKKENFSPTSILQQKIYECSFFIVFLTFASTVCATCLLRFGIHLDVVLRRNVEAVIFQTLLLPPTKNEKTTVDNFFCFGNFVTCLLLHFIFLRKQKPSFTAITLPSCCCCWLPDPFRGMGAWPKTIEPQKPGNSPESEPEVVQRQRVAKE